MKKQGIKILAPENGDASKAWLLHIKKKLILRLLLSLLEMFSSQSKPVTKTTWHVLTYPHITSKIKFKYEIPSILNINAIYLENSESIQSIYS